MYLKILNTRPLLALVNIERTFLSLYLKLEKQPFDKTYLKFDCETDWSIGDESREFFIYKNIIT